jgi:hypothetical protein
MRVTTVISSGFHPGCVTPKYRTPELALISYVSAEMVAGDGFMALSIRSPIRFAARNCGSVSRLGRLLRRAGRWLSPRPRRERRPPGVPPPGDRAFVKGAHITAREVKSLTRGKDGWFWKLSGQDCAVGAARREPVAFYAKIEHIKHCVKIVADMSVRTAWRGDSSPPEKAFPQCPRKPSVVGRAAGQGS